jgi:hypothetical protein
VKILQGPQRLQIASWHRSHVRLVRSPAGAVASFTSLEWVRDVRLSRDTLWVNVEFTAHEPWIVIVLGFPIVRTKGGTERKLSGRSFLSRSPHEAFPESLGVNDRVSSTYLELAEQTFESLNSDGCNLVSDVKSLVFENAC